MTGDDDHKIGDAARDWAKEAKDTAVTQLGDTAQEWADGAKETAAQTIGDTTQKWASEAQDVVAGLGARLGLGEREPAGQAGDHAESAEPERLDLSDQDRLPWLEAQDDDEEYVGVDNRRVFGAVAAMLAVLALIVGGIWWYTHRNENGAHIADGSTIQPPAGPYKETPKDPGGKTYDGTGDSSFAVSQGESRPAQLAQGEAAKAGANGAANSPTGVAGAATAAAQAAASASAYAQGKAMPAAPVAKVAAAPSAPVSVGGVVQVGAYTSQSSAEAGWNRLVKQSAALSGVAHRIVEGKADIGTVYRVQALTGAGGGSALCSRLRAEGLACQVKQ